MPTKIAEPWLSFLRDVDRALDRPVEVHCLGGFVLAALWELPRPTGDIDFVEIEPSSAAPDLLRVGGQGSDLQAQHKLHFHQVTVAEFPEAYASRLIDMTPARVRRLRLMAMEVHDLVLAKLSRNGSRDRADVEFLASRGILDPRLLKERFVQELQPYVLNETRETTTLNLWLDEFFGGA